MELMRRGLMGLALAAAAAGCGSGTEELTCAILEDPANCWAAAAEAAAACVPPSTQIAVFAADRASCTFSDGTRVVFDAPLPADTFDLERFAFTIERDGVACARFVDTFENRMELEAGGHSAVSELHAGGAFHLHCGDGPDYESDFDLLFTCPANTAPTDGFDVGPDYVTFLISAVTTPGTLFRCEL